MTESCSPAPVPQRGSGLAIGASAIAPVQSTSDAPPAAASSTHGDDWRTALDDDLRRAAVKFETPAEVLRSYMALEKRLGRSVVLPDRESSSEEIEAFYERLGRPKTPDDYEISFPAGASETSEDDGKRAFLDAMHRAGATAPAVQAAIDWYFAALAENDSNAERAASAKLAETEATIRRDWGSAYDRQVEGARRAARKFGGPELLAVLNEAGIAHHPALLRTFAAIGATTAEDSILESDGGREGASAHKRIDRLMAEHYGRPSYVSAPVQEELQGLYGELYGNAVTVDSSNNSFLRPPRSSR